MTELVDAGLLHPECDRIFRIKDHRADTGRRVITLHRHQRDAVEAAASRRSYVLVTVWSRAALVVRPESSAVLRSVYPRDWRDAAGLTHASAA